MRRRSKRQPSEEALEALLDQLTESTERACQAMDDALKELQASDRPWAASPRVKNANELKSPSLILAPHRSGAR